MCKVVKKLAAIQKHIDTLESKGWTVSLWHERRDSHNVPAETAMELKSPDDWVYIGQAFCNPSDTYDRAEGTRLAWARAIQEVSGDMGRENLKALLTP